MFRIIDQTVALFEVLYLTYRNSQGPTSTPRFHSKPLVMLIKPCQTARSH